MYSCTFGLNRLCAICSPISCSANTVLFTPTNFKALLCNSSCALATIYILFFNDLSNTEVIKLETVSEPIATIAASYEGTPSSFKVNSFVASPETGYVTLPSISCTLSSFLSIAKTSCPRL